MSKMVNTFDEEQHVSDSIAQPSVLLLSLSLCLGYGRPDVICLPICFIPKEPLAMLGHSTEKAQWESLLFSSNSFLLWEEQSTIMMSFCRWSYEEELGMDVCIW